jgi:hypothetical protein
MANLQKYLDSAVSVLEKFGIVQHNEQSQLAELLNDVAVVDEARVLAIAKTIKYMGSFNELVRDNVEEMDISQRYNNITQLFDSIREDSKTLVGQLSDGKIDWKEKAVNKIMLIRRGSTHDRFEKIASLYTAVSKDVKEQLEKEVTIMDAYMDFRFALKEAEILSHEVMQTQEGNLSKAKGVFDSAAQLVTNYAGTDAAEKSRLELARDEANRAFNDENRRYQLIKDVAENLTVGYNVGETLVIKLKQTHDIKEQVYKKSVTFFTTNEHVFTIMDAVYTSQQGLNEASKTVDALTEGANKGLESIAELGFSLEKAALKAGYGATISSSSVQKLVDSIVAYQTESVKMIEDYRNEATANSKEVARIVEEGKEKCKQAMLNYSPDKTKQLPN